MLKNNNVAAQKVMERCDLLASFSEEPGCITRRFASPPMHQVHSAITSWLRDIGVPVEIDAIGNLIGHYEGSHPHAKTLVIGIESDILFPIREQELLVSLIPGASLEVIHSLYGHDGFLLEFKQIEQLVKHFISLSPTPCIA